MFACQISDMHTMHIQTSKIGTADLSVLSGSNIITINQYNQILSTTYGRTSLKSTPFTWMDKSVQPW